MLSVLMLSPAGTQPESSAIAGGCRPQPRRRRRTRMRADREHVTAWPHVWAAEMHV
jgi:hypothetical protein